MIKPKHNNPPANERRQWRRPPSAPAASGQHSERKPSQAELVAQCRRESCIDHCVPLAAHGVPSARPLEGPSVAEYYRQKQARGERGKFDPLWRLALWHGDAVDGGIRLATLNSRAA